MASSKPEVQLVPWDFTSSEHVERLLEQRIACGWDSEAVEGWRIKQKSGAFNLQWIVISETDPERVAKLLKHTSAYPSEITSIPDTALSYGGKTRTISSPQHFFIPVSHICLGPVSAHYDDIKEPFPEGSYWISNFYVSRALQSTGLGRAAMDTVESIATSEPLNATVLGLNAINKIDIEREEKYEALGLPIPPVT